jgi:hypothetical protein
VDWWNYPSSAGDNVRIAYTYPNGIFTDERFDVGITLEFIQYHR